MRNGIKLIYESLNSYVNTKNAKNNEYSNNTLKCIIFQKLNFTLVKMDPISNHTLTKNMNQENIKRYKWNISTLTHTFTLLNFSRKYLNNTCFLIIACSKKVQLAFYWTIFTVQVKWSKIPKYSTSFLFMG